MQNKVRTYRDFLSDHTSHLDDQDIFGIISCLCAKVLDSVLIAISQIVKPQAVLLRIYDLA